MIENDLHQVYGFDIGEPGLLQARTGHWLRLRIIGLLSEPKTRIFRAFRDREEQQHRPRQGDDPEFD